MTDTEIEQEIQAKGKTAARVTPADIEVHISAEFFFTADEGVVGASMGSGFDAQNVIRHDNNYAEGPMRLLTFCVLVLRNGFTVTGKAPARVLRTSMPRSAARLLAPMPCKRFGR